MRHTYIISIIIAALLGSTLCNGQEKFDYESFPAITGERVLKGAELMRPQGLYFVEGGFLIYDYDGEYIFSFYPSEKSKKAKRVAPIGQGSMKYMTAANIYCNPNDHTLFLYDQHQRRADTYDVSGNNVRSSVKNLISSHNLKYENGFEVMPLGKGRYVMNGVFADSMLAVMDSTGKILYTFGEYPGDKSDIDKPIIFFMRNQSNISVNPSGTRVAIAGIESDWVAFYGLENDKPRLLKQYFSHDSGSDAKQTNSATISYMPNKESVITYRWITSNDKHVYLMYDGRTNGEAQNGTQRPRSILQFDWEGNFIQGFQVKERLYAITVSPDDNFIYGIVRIGEEDDIMKKYPLK